MKLLTDLLPVASGATAVRLLRESDLLDFHAYRSDSGLAIYQGWSPMTEADALAFLEQMAKVRSLSPGTWIQVGIADARSNTLLGDIGLFLDEDESSVDIGFTLASQHQGRGHAFHAISALIPLISACSPAQQIRGITDSRNSSSIRLLQRLGFTRSNEYRTRFKGEPCIEQVYLRPIDQM